MTDETLVISILEGANRKLTRHEILAQIESWGEYDARQASNGAHLRQVIQSIRRQRLTGRKVLLSDSKGYWLSEDHAEISQWIAKQMKRANEHMTTASTVESHFNEIVEMPTVAVAEPDAPLRVKESAKTNNRKQA